MWIARSLLSLLTLRPICSSCPLSCPLLDKFLTFLIEDFFLVGSVKPRHMFTTPSFKCGRINQHEARVIGRFDGWQLLDACLKLYCLIGNSWELLHDFN